MVAEELPEHDVRVGLQAVMGVAQDAFDSKSIHLRSSEPWRTLPKVGGGVTVAACGFCGVAAGAPPDWACAVDQVKASDSPKRAKAVNERREIKRIRWKNTRRLSQCSAPHSNVG